MKLTEYILLEDKINYLANQYSDKLLKKAKEDQFYTPSDDTAEAVVRDLSEMDPTPNNKLLQWVVKRYLKGDFKVEDAPDVKNTLSQFVEKQRSLDKKDINQYPSLADLSTAVGTAVDVTSKRQQKIQTKHEGIDVVKKGSDGILIHVKTEAASCYYGKGTKWCTAATESKNYFNDYNSRGEVYIFLAKDGRKYQFFVSDDADVFEFSNENNNPADVPALKKNYPTARWYFEAIAEPFIAKDPEWAYVYARDVIKGRWPEAEPVIAKAPEWAYRYARYVIKRRFPEAEPVIAKDPLWAFYYAKIAIKGRFPEAESAIARDPQLAYWYAKDVIKGRFPEAEPFIAKDPEWAYVYARDVMEGRWPEVEPVIAKDPEWAYVYARYHIKGRFPEAEPFIAKDPEWAYLYARDVIKGRWPEAGIE
jgi:hypothetical protein